MKAAVYYGDHDVRDRDRAGSGARATASVLLRVLRTGMCGTDATEWKAGPHPVPERERRTGDRPRRTV